AFKNSRICSRLSRSPFLMLMINTQHAAPHPLQAHSALETRPASRLILRYTRLPAPTGIAAGYTTALKRYLPFLLLVLQALVFFRHVLFLPGYVIPWDLRGLHLAHAY